MDLCYSMSMSKPQTLRAINRVLPHLGLAETRVFNYILQETTSLARESSYITLDRFRFCTKLSTKPILLAISRLLEKGLIIKTKHPGIRTPEYLVRDDAVQLTKNEPYQKPELP